MNSSHPTPLYKHSFHCVYSLPLLLLLHVVLQRPPVCRHLPPEKHQLSLLHTALPQREREERVAVEWAALRQHGSPERSHGASAHLSARVVLYPRHNATIVSCPGLDWLNHQTARAHRTGSSVWGCVMLISWWLAGEWASLPSFCSQTNSTDYALYVCPINDVQFRLIFYLKLQSWEFRWLSIL